MHEELSCWIREDPSKTSGLSTTGEMFMDAAKAAIC